ncbi:MAG: NADH-quinone oxidoreductase subunit C [Brevefilum sp.]
MEPINLDKLLHKIQDFSEETAESSVDIKNDTTFIISPEHILAISKILVNEFDCSHLSGITAQQRDDQKDVIEVLYHFWKGIGFSFMMVLPVENPEIPSIKSLLPGADFYEREVAEMFGISFTGREETPPLLLPDNWSEGPPFIRNEDQDG